MSFLSNSDLVWMAMFSVVAFFLSIITIPWVIIKLPEDYFVNHIRKKSPWASQHIFLRLFLLSIKNILGVIIIIMGIIMLILPGQGLLSIIIGVILIDFPGKFQFECWLVQRGPILKVSNKIRGAAKKPPFIFNKS